MANHLPEIESFLPFGNSLRELITQSYISPFELKRTLRARGIFSNKSDKDYTVPLLMTIILSPQEFETLREKQNTKEDNIKTNSFTLEVKEENIENKNLLSLIPNNLNLNKIIEKEFKNYSVDGQPNFHLVDQNNPDKIELPFITTRINRTKDWATNKTKHDGTIIIEKVKEDDKTFVKITQKYTSTETKEVGSEFAKVFTQNLKDNKVIDKEIEPRKILFNHFTNEHRIKFLQNLMVSVKNSHGLLELKDTTDIELSPDRNAQMPQQLAWLQEKIDQIKLKGKDLFNSFFVQEVENHKFLIFSGIEARYKFSSHNITGTCSILFEFHGYSKDGNIWSELEIKLNSLAFDKGFKSSKKQEYQGKIIDFFEKIKFEYYEKFKIPVSTSPVLK